MGGPQLFLSLGHSHSFLLLHLHRVFCLPLVRLSFNVTVSLGLVSILDREEMEGFVSIDLEEGSGESTDNSHLCLVGKVLASKLLNRTTVSKIMYKPWRIDKRFSEMLCGLLWGNLLVLQPLKMGYSVSEMDFSYCPFWVQVHGLPVDRLTRRNGQLIAEHLGQLIGVETPHDGLLLHRSFLRLRVEMDISKPFPRGFLMKRKDPNTLNITEKWVDFKFERLSDYCYDCGKIGHNKNSGKFIGREAGYNSGYGPHLRTRVALKLNLPADFI
ncbi:hypothetical protein ACSBR1_025631 [Camellia fascicularis]